MTPRRKASTPATAARLRECAWGGCGGSKYVCMCLRAYPTCSPRTDPRPIIPTTINIPKKNNSTSPSLTNSAGSGAWPTRCSASSASTTPRPSKSSTAATDPRGTAPCFWIVGSRGSRRGCWSRARWGWAKWCMRGGRGWCGHWGMAVVSWVFGRWVGWRWRGVVIYLDKFITT